MAECEWCGEEMEVERVTKRYCSPRCRAASWNADRRKLREWRDARLAAQGPPPPIDTEAVKAAILELLAEGAATSEVLVWKLQERGLVPGSPKATGAAFSALRKSGQIKPIGHGPRYKAGGASGAVVYTLPVVTIPADQTGSLDKTAKEILEEHGIASTPSANPMDYDKPVRVVAGGIRNWRKLHPEDCPNTTAGWVEKFEWDTDTVEEAFRLIAAMEDSVSTS